MIMTYLQAVTTSHFQLYPGSIFLILIFLMLFLFILKNGLTFQSLVAAANTLGSQPMALLVLVIGLISVKICHDIGENTNIAAGIIGCALGLLNNQFAKQHTTETTGGGPPNPSSTTVIETGTSPTVEPTQTSNSIGTGVS
jgi:hypothetical protein